MSYSKFKKKLQVRPILNTKSKFVTGSPKKDIYLLQTIKITRNVY